MSSDSGNRSSLEVMLEALRRRDTKPKDVLPGLPARPAIRGRLPSQKRRMPIKFEVSETEEERALRRYQEMVLRSNVFRSKSFAKVEEPEESPYGKTPEITNCRGRWEPVNRLDSAPLEENFKWSNTTDSVGKKKLHVWCRVPDIGWELGSIKSFKGEDANVLFSDGKVLTLSIGNLLPANPDLLDDVDDLIQLGYLNEPSVLHSLKHRHSRDMIYTKAGDVLVAINPFKKVHLYGNDPVAAYKGKTSNSPHVYAIADSAFSKMMRDGGNQSIIISGESGSGKTETAKIAMQFLAGVGGGSGIEHKVLQINTILESFGNTKTSRNDNSSRFGNLIEIHFHIGGKICGVKIQTILLEKLRVVGRAKGERSYHVFYQLCAGAPALLREKLNLKAASEYEYLKQSDCLRISDVDDAKKFHELMEALNIVQISKEDQENAFSMLAAVLWLGNIEFSVIDNEDHVEVVSSEGVTSAAKLMGCKAHELMLTLSTRRIEAVNDEIVQKLTLSQAIDTRDALAKSIYSNLFVWLVEQINKSLGVGNLFTGRSINILDIYGFESLHKNNFEQFCINYANERLQQHFIRHLFKLEQEEYIQDGIDWTNVEFIDNTDCLNLIEKKPLGLLSLLDEESTSLEATDLSFEYKLKQHLNDSPCFNGAREGAFQVCHYAGVVLYETHGFLEQNRDPLPSDCIQLMLSCDCQPLQLFASRMLNHSQNPVSSTMRVSGVDSQKQIAMKFKGQLFNLLQQLENTTPHFIRCIRPNSNKLPGVYEDKLVLQQLRCCGVLEVVRLSRSGYPHRMTHYQFAERYGFLLLKNVASEDPLNVAIFVLQKLNIRPEMYQVGYTKLFFRAGQIVLLENIRNHTMQRILWVQKSLRSLQSQRSFQKLKKGTTTLQSFIRGSLVRKNLIGSNTYGNIFNQMTVQNQASKVQASVAAELEMQVLKAVVALRQKEEENVTLRKQLQEYVMRCSHNEAKMKSIQESWQKQTTSLQMNNLPAVKKAHLPGRLDASPAQYSYDSVDTMPTETSTTPEATQGRHGLISNGGLGRNSDNTQNAVGHLVREFEQQKKAFEDDVRVLVEVRPGQSGSSTNPQVELRKLKARFRSWNKEYRVQLRVAKTRVHKLVVSDGAKARKKWWKLRRCLKS